MLSFISGMFVGVIIGVSLMALVSINKDDRRK